MWHTFVYDWNISHTHEVIRKDFKERRDAEACYEEYIKRGYSCELSFERPAEWDKIIKKWNEGVK